MGLPSLEEVKEAIHSGFNKKYMEKIKDDHIEAIYNEVVKLTTFESTHLPPGMSFGDE